MLERVVAYIERHQLLPEQGTLVVGVSGGADSLCLAHILRQICGPGRHFAGISLQAAHLDHQLRGEESTTAALIVAELLQTWDIPLTSGAVDVAALASQEKRSLEEAARLARYRFLREVARGGRIAVAHHADDQVETLLLHWLRGSGLAGMVGMLPRQQDIIRPLLEVTRAETHAYCQEQGITPLEDSSNSDTHFLRNRIRHEVIPLLAQLNPGLSQTLLRNAEVARIDLDWLEAQVDACWNSVVVSQEALAIKLDIHALRTLSLSLQHHLLRRATALLCSGQSPLEPRHFLLIERLLSQEVGQRERVLHLPQNLHVLQQAGYLTFEQHTNLISREDLPPEKRVTVLSIPGSARIPATPWEARAEFLSEELDAQIRPALDTENWSLLRQLLEPVTPWITYADASVVGAHLLVRTRQPGDRIQPLGMGQEKKAQDIFVDRHIKRSERDTIPLFFSEKHCIWIAGCCLDHRARLTSKTRRIVRLSLHSV